MKRLARPWTPPGGRGAGHRDRPGGGQHPLISARIAASCRRDPLRRDQGGCGRRPRPRSSPRQRRGGGDPPLRRPGRERGDGVGGRPPTVPVGQPYWAPCSHPHRPPPSRHRPGSVPRLRPGGQRGRPAHIDRVLRDSGEPDPSPVRPPSSTGTAAPSQSPRPGSDTLVAPPSPASQVVGVADERPGDRRPHPTGTPSRRGPPMLDEGASAGRWCGPPAWTTPSCGRGAADRGETPGAGLALVDRGDARRPGGAGVLDPTPSASWGRRPSTGAGTCPAPSAIASTRPAR